MSQDKGKKEKNHIPPIAKIKKESRCFFCKKKGHLEKDYHKDKAWLGKKGNYFSFVFLNVEIIIPLRLRDANADPISRPMVTIRSKMY